MNHKRIKEQSRKILNNNFLDYWKGYLIIIAADFICLSFFKLLLDTSNHELVNSLVSFGVSLLIAPLSFGFTSYIMAITRGDEHELVDIFQYFKSPNSIWIISILVSFSIMLWSFLFIIPGIIIAISYSLVSYIYIDKNVNPKGCIEESMQLMSGYKWDYFTLLSSFIGLFVLSILTFGLLFVYLIPYVNISKVLYYDEVRALKKRLTKE